MEAMAGSAEDRATIVLRLTYSGGAYSGFAEQPSAPTVARELRRALETFLRREVDITCAGRTDAGVHAIGQMEETVRYISKVLQAPETALRWADRLEAEMAGLGRMPGRYPLTPEEPWRSEGIHKMPVENFLVYYWINEPQKTVWVTVVVYGRRDQVQALLDMPKGVF